MKQLIEEILAQGKTVAVVGLSKDPSKDSFKVAQYLKNAGYRIIPVNPTATEIMGEKAYPSLLDIPYELATSIDTADVFRPSQEIPSIVEQVLKLRSRYGRPKYLWLQLGITHAEAEQRAGEAGIKVVSNACMMAEHSKR